MVFEQRGTTQRVVGTTAQRTPQLVPHGVWSQTTASCTLTRPVLGSSHASQRSRPWPSLPYDEWLDAAASVPHAVDGEPARRVP